MNTCVTINSKQEIYWLYNRY